MLDDSVVANYKRYPLLSVDERMKIISSIKGVSKVIRQDSMSYKEVIKELKPDFVVHGDDWREGVQKPIREEVIELLKEYGGELVEFPYSHNEEYEKLELAAREQLSIPDYRRARLKKLIGIKG